MRRGRLLASVVGVTIAAALALLASTSTGRAGAARAETAIFYYPWYSTPARDGFWAHWYVSDKEGQQVLSTPYYPLRGLYSSSNVKVVNAHMREIATAGIGTVIVSWWGFGSPEGERLPLVTSAAAQNGMRVAVHIEPYAGRTPASTVADIVELSESGYQDFYVYDSDRDAVEDWAAALADLEGVRVFAHTHLVGRAKASGFDGLYTYDVVTWNGNSFARTCTQARRAGLLCAPSVGPGYDATLVRADELVRPRLHGAHYDRMWRAAVRAKPDVITITSYNEWQEGTQIEPARTQVHSRQAYEGAWGMSGKAAQRAYLEATTRWVLRYRAAMFQ
jgi:glycoprotein endo-alpha-1,2-mannosidase